MNIILSVATSKDHYIDDMTEQRLRLSTASDWAEVYALRAECDAILIGGETLRRDNPTLGLKSESLKESRRSEGRASEPMRVIVSGRGDISAEQKLFYRGEGSVVIFSNVERLELSKFAEVIVSDTIDPAFIVTELEKRGVSNLFVEGGAKILNMFLDSGMVDRLRVAVNPTIIVADAAAPRFVTPKWIEECDAVEQNLDGMLVKTYSLKKLNDESPHHLKNMKRVIEISRLSPPKQSCYRVGALIETLKGEIFEGYTLETAPTHHAEQAAMHKAILAGADLIGATIYASMEPCSSRSSEPKSCSELILDHKMKRVLFALYEPSHFVECHGAENLRRAGVDVIHMAEFADDVFDINSHVLIKNTTV
ncbi:MAG: dihydrofolate reductase family protein [Rikenellaceae bacterium]